VAQNGIVRLTWTVYEFRGRPLAKTVDRIMPKLFSLSDFHEVAFAWFLRLAYQLAI